MTGALPQTPVGELTALQRPPIFKGPTSKTGEERSGEEEGKRRGRIGRSGEREEGEGKKEGRDETAPGSCLHPRYEILDKTLLISRLYTDVETSTVSKCVYNCSRNPPEM